MTFWIGAAECRLSLPWAMSLKDRRQIVRSLTDGACAKFNISAADLGPAGALREASLGFTAAASSSAELEERLNFLEKYLGQREALGEFDITNITREVFTYGDISN